MEEGKDARMDGVYVCLYACMDVWLYGCMDIRMYVCKHLATHDICLS